MTPCLLVGSRDFRWVQLVLAESILLRHILQRSCAQRFSFLRIRCGLRRRESAFHHSYHSVGQGIQSVFSKDTQQVNMNAVRPQPLVTNIRGISLQPFEDSHSFLRVPDNGFIGAYRQILWEYFRDNTYSGVDVRPAVCVDPILLTSEHCVSEPLMQVRPRLVQETEQSIVPDFLIHATWRVPSRPYPHSHWHNRQQQCPGESLPALLINVRTTVEPPCPNYHHAGNESTQSAHDPKVW